MEKICILGSINVDYTIDVDRIPNLGETIIGNEYYLGYGGKGANQAVAASRLNATVEIIGKVGDDLNGQKYLQHLQTENIILNNLKLENDITTGVAFVNVDNNGDNNIIVIPGANSKISIHDIHEAKNSIIDSKILLSQLEVPMESVFESFIIAKKNNVFTVLNPAPYTNIGDSYYKYIDLLIPNEIEMQQLIKRKLNSVKDYVEAARELISKGVKVVIITLGERGALLVSNDNYNLIKPNKVKSVDTTAAGDSFVGGVVSYLSKSDKISYTEILNSCIFATDVASLTIQKVGAQSSLPYLNDVNKIRSKQQIN